MCTRFKIETWGCQMNEYDSQKMSGLLKSAGFEPTDSDQEADIFILNTCSVREKAAHKIYSRLGMLSKRYGSDKLYGVCGCVASQDANSLFQRASYVNFVLGTRSTHLLLKAIETARSGKRFLDTGDHRESINTDPQLIDRETATKAYIAIMEGCDNFCTYCVVPFTRGRERSRPLPDILNEVRDATENRNIHEIELLGQNVNSYNDAGKRFSDVLAAVSDIPGVSRLRFLTSHPKDFDEELVRLIADRPNISRYLHLPMQSGSDAILKKMGRRYTRAEYLEKIDMLRHYLPQAWVSSDFIVGFPGEKEQDFQDTMDVIHRVRYDNVFSFKYSPRPGTAALKLKEHAVDAAIADGRLMILQKAQEAIQLVKHQQMIGSRIQVLVESVSKRNPKKLTGRTEGNHVVHFEAGRGAALIGSFADVEITAVTMASLEGRLI